MCHIDKKFRKCRGCAVFPDCHSLKLARETIVQCRDHQAGRVDKCPNRGQPDPDEPNDIVRSHNGGYFTCDLCQQLIDAGIEDARDRRNLVVGKRAP